MLDYVVLVNMLIAKKWMYQVYMHNEISGSYFLQKNAVKHLVRGYLL